MIDNNLTSIILSALSLVGVIFTGIIGLLNRKGLAEVKDGLQSKMIQAQQGEATAVGTLAGMATERDRHDATTDRAAAAAAVVVAVAARPVLGVAPNSPTGTPDDPVAVKNVK